MTKDKKGYNILYYQGNRELFRSWEPIRERSERLIMTLSEMRQIKEERGYSLAQLSKYSGVPLGTIQKIFSGETIKPRKSTLDAIEKVFLGDESVYQGKAYAYQLESNEQHGDYIRETGAYKIQSEEKKQGEYTLEDYYALPEEQRVELIDGVIYDMSSPIFVHQMIAGEVYGQIREYIGKHKGECVPAIAPVDVQLDCDDRTMVQPDVLIVCDRDKIRGFGIFGAPDFVLEVLSPSTRKKDLILKLGKYMEAGVREYWVIDPNKMILITYDFLEEGLPCVYPLKGEVGLAIYEGKLKINLDNISEMIEEYGREE